MKKVLIYTDGSCLGNPGPGGWSAILCLAGSTARKEICGGYRLTTNNRMEILAAIEALNALKEPCQVDLYTDSQYLSNAIDKGWLNSWQKRGWQKANKKPVPNLDLWQKLLPLLTLHNIKFFWLRGHAGQQENERCDYLARTCAQKKDLPPDIPYELIAGKHA